MRKAAWRLGPSAGITRGKGAFFPQEQCSPRLRIPALQSWPDGHVGTLDYMEPRAPPGRWAGVVRPHSLERVRQISVAARGATVRHGILCRGRCIPQSVCLKRDAIHVAASRVVDQRRCVCDSHFARTLSPSELAAQNSTSRLSVCCTWGICSCRRGEHPRTNGRNGQPAPARPGARNLADHDRSAGLCGRVGCGGWACPSATK